MVVQTPIEIGTLLYSGPGYQDGRPCLAGTNTTVHTIAAHYLMGLSPEQILEEFPRTDLPRIHAAIAYFLANRETVMGELDQDRKDAERLAVELNSPRPN